MQKRHLAWLALLALGLAACDTTEIPGGLTSDPTGTSDPVGGSGEVSNDPGSSSEGPAILDTAGVLEKLRDPDGIAYTGIMLTGSGYRGSTLRYGESEIAGFVSEDEWYNVEEGYDPLHCLKGEDGNAIEPYLTIYNEIAYDPILDSEDEPISFSVYDNPFVGLADTRLVADGDNHWVITAADETEGLALALPLSGYSDIVVETIEITAADGELDTLKIDFATAEFADQETGSVIVYEMSIEADFCSKEEVGVPVYEPLPTLPEHEALGNLFDSMAALNWTATYLDSSTDLETGVEEEFDMTLKYAGTAMSLSTVSGATTQNFVQDSATTISEVAGDAEGNVVRVGLPAEGTIAELQEFDFGVAPEFFDPVEGKEGVYELNDDYAGAVLYVYPMRNLDYCIYDYVSPIIITLTEAGAEIDFEYNDYSSYSGNVHIEISNIGTTVCDIEAEDVGPYVPPTNWAETGLTDELLVDCYGGASWLDKLPFPEFDDLYGIVNSDILGMFYWLDIYLTDGGDANADAEAYCSALVTAGWTYLGVDDYDNTPIYEYRDLTEMVAYTCNVVADPEYNCVSLYLEADIIPTDTPLRNLLVDLTTENMNSTVTCEIDIAYYTGYGTDAQAPIDGYSDNITIVHEFTDTDLHFYYLNDGVKAGEEWYIADETGTTMDVYEIDEQTGEPYLSYDDEEGTLFDMAYSWMDMEGYTDDILIDGDGTYTLSGDTWDYLLIIFSVFNLDATVVPTGTAVYDEVAGTVTIDGLATEEGTIDDEDGNEIAVTGVISVTLTISDIGTTVVTAPDLTEAPTEETPATDDTIASA